MTLSGCEICGVKISGVTTLAGTGRRLCQACHAGLSRLLERRPLESDQGRTR